MKLPPTPRSFGLYILTRDHHVRRVRDVLRWARFLEATELRRVARSEVGGLVVSTVFLGVDHGWPGEPLLFETMVFRTEGAAIDADDLDVRRYATWADAEEGHAEIVRDLGARLAAITRATRGKAKA